MADNRDESVALWEALELRLLRLGPVTNAVRNHVAREFWLAQGQLESQRAEHARERAKRAQEPRILIGVDLPLDW